MGCCCHAHLLDLLLHIGCFAVSESLESRFLAVCSQFRAMIQRGYIRVHPQDTYKYPLEFYNVDPQKFVPPEDKPCWNWGIASRKQTGDTFRDSCQKDAALRHYQYGKDGNPFEQYVSVLARRKVDKIQSVAVQEAMKNTLRLRGKFSIVHRRHSLPYCYLFADTQLPWRRTTTTAGER